MSDHDTLIVSYTRAQAIDDGILVDVTPTARGAGFRCAVALTSSVYHAFIAVPAGVSGQTADGRLQDVLSLARLAIRRSGPERNELLYTVAVRNDDRRPAATVALKLVVGPGDQGEPVVTIMQPDED